VISVEAAKGRLSVLRNHTDSHEVESATLYFFINTLKSEGTTRDW
jgi:hypothetical protein